MSRHKKGGREPKKYKKSGTHCKMLKHKISTAHGKHARGKALGAWAKHCK